METLKQPNMTSAGFFIESEKRAQAVDEFA